VPLRRSAVVASAETLAYAIATGVVGDPRTFKRPVRITVPRALPTDDVLVARKLERGERGHSGRQSRRDLPEPSDTWKIAQTLEIVEGSSFQVGETNGRPAIAVICTTLDEVRELSARATDIGHTVRAVLAPYIPSALVALFSAAGIAAIRLDAAAAKGLKGQRTIALPPPSQWPERQPTTITVGTTKLPLTWLALGAERAWATGRGA
jgi:aconitate hydratase